MKKKILVVGGSGLLGNSFLKFSSDYTIFTNIFNKKPFFPSKHVTLNLFNIEDIKKFIKENDIKIILNFAALADVEKCSEDPEYAYSLNSILPKNLALAAEETNSFLIHISTDHLFGDKHLFHGENDDVVLLNKYAETKYQGEQFVRNNCKNFIILRTNFFCLGYSKSSFPDWIIASLKARKNIELFDDVFFNPVHSFKIFESLELLYKKNCTGLFNIASTESISKFEFGITIAEKLNLDVQYISRCSISRFSDLKIKRPKNMLLSNQKIISNIAIDLSIINSIDTYIKEISEEAL